MTVEVLLATGAIAGVVAALFIGNSRLGCTILWIVPVVTTVLIIVDQRLHPGVVRSTSALDFVFGPLWPSLGALTGFVAGRLLRAVVVKVGKQPGA